MVSAAMMAESRALMGPKKGTEDMVEGIVNGSRPHYALHRRHQLRRLHQRGRLRLRRRAGIDPRLIDTEAAYSIRRAGREGIKMYKRILLAYDGSIEGRTALREGALLARQCSAEVFLLSVLADTGTLLLSEVALAGASVRMEDDFRAILMRALHD